MPQDKMLSALLPNFFGVLDFELRGLRRHWSSAPHSKRATWNS